MLSCTEMGSKDILWDDLQQAGVIISISGWVFNGVYFRVYAFKQIAVVSFVYFLSFIRHVDAGLFELIEVFLTSILPQS